VGRLVEEAGGVTEDLVDLLDDARDRSVDVRSGLDRLDGANRLWNTSQLTIPRRGVS
jgi:hypothetical protein